MRLISCRVCKTVEECPDYDGPMETDPGTGLKVDPLVEGIIMKHTERDPLGHGGVALEYAPFTIGHVPDAKWATDRANVLDSLRQDNKKAGFDDWVYEALSTYKDDAMKCYNQHRRPETCIDWRADSKRLGRPTIEGMQALKADPKLAAKDPFLCDYCPVRSEVQTRVNFKRGLYK